MSHNDHVSNEEVRTKIQEAIGPQGDLDLAKTKETYIRSDQNHLARHSERKKKTRQTEEKVGGQHQGIDRDFFPRVILQCRLSDGIQTPSV